MDEIKQLLSAHGRSRRSEWWVFGLAMTAVSAVLMWLSVGLIAGWEHVTIDPSAVKPTTVKIIQGFWDLLFFWPLLALSIRRAHDRNSSGWFVISLNVSTLPISLAYNWAPASFWANYEWVWMTYSFVWAVGGLFLLISLGFLDGTQGPNRYGPSPKDEPRYQRMALD